MLRNDRRENILIFSHFCNQYSFQFNDNAGKTSRFEWCKSKQLLKIYGEFDTFKEKVLNKDEKRVL